MNDLQIKAVLDNAEFMFSSGKTESAIEAYQSLLSRLEHENGVEDENFGQISFKLAMELENIGKYPESAYYYAKSVNSFASNMDFGDTHLVTIKCRHHLGRVLSLLGIFDAARIQQERILEAFQHRGISEDTAELAIIAKHNLADTLTELGEYELAFSRQAEVLASMEESKDFGILDQRLINSLHLMALILKSLGKYDESAKYLNMCIQKQEANSEIGRLDLRTLEDKFSLGNMFIEMQNYRAAIREYTDIIERNHESSVFDDSKMALINNNIGFAFFSMEGFEEALPYHLEALRLRELSLGIEHPETLESAREVALTLNRLERYSKALSYQRIYVEGRVKQPEFDHNDANFIFGIIHLASLLERNGDFEEAIAHREILLEKLDNHPDFGYTNLDTIDNKINLALDLHNLGRFAKAARIQYQLLAIMDVHPAYGANHPRTKFIRQTLERTLCLLEDC